MNPDAPLRDALAGIQAGIMGGASWMGVPALKNPLDAWVYQELVWDTRPDVIVEVGNAYGGSTLMLAHLCDLAGHGRVIGVDIDHDRVPQKVRDHPRVELVTGDAAACALAVATLVGPDRNVLVIEDSSHSAPQTLAVLEAYAPLVQPGGIMVCEDTVCHHGVDDGPDPGPAEAVAEFLHRHDDWAANPTLERFGVTWNAGGWLRRLR